MIFRSIAFRFQKGAAKQASHKKSRRAFRGARRGKAVQTKWTTILPGNNPARKRKKQIAPLPLKTIRPEIARRTFDICSGSAQRFFVGVRNSSAERAVRRRRFSARYDCTRISTGTVGLWFLPFKPKRRSTGAKLSFRRCTNWNLSASSIGERSSPASRGGIVRPYTGSAARLRSCRKKPAVSTHLLRSGSQNRQNESGRTRGATWRKTP